MVTQGNGSGLISRRASKGETPDLGEVVDFDPQAGGLSSPESGGGFPSAEDQALVGREPAAANTISDLTQIDVPPVLSTMMKVGSLYQAVHRLLEGIRDQWDGELVVEGPNVESVFDDLDVSVDVVLLGATRDEAREVRRWTYNFMAESMSTDLLDSLSVFVTFRRD